MELNKIRSAGFYLNKNKGKIKDLAFISLRSSLRAYSSTYRGISHSLDIIVSDREEHGNWSPYTIAYVEAACEAITHFHHFVELILKDILSGIHPLLAVDANDKHEILHDLLFNRAINEIEHESIRQVEFSKALDRVVSLLKSGKVDQTKYGFIQDAMPWLRVLNELRNRIAHRGVFVLRNEALDTLFGCHALPFLQQVLCLPEYEAVAFWKYSELHAAFDPMDELITAMKGRKYPAFKVALLKELVRAAYTNPRGKYKGFLKNMEQELITRSELIAKHVAAYEAYGDVKSCPVCGLLSLVLYKDIVDDTDYETGKSTYAYQYVYSVKCLCCTFEIDHAINNISEMNVPIEDYWQQTDLLA